MSGGEGRRSSSMVTVTAEVVGGMGDGTVDSGSFPGGFAWMLRRLISASTTRSLDSDASSIVCMRGHGQKMYKFQSRHLGPFDGGRRSNTCGCQAGCRQVT